MSDSDKYNLKKMFRKLLEETTLPLDTLSHDVFLQSINNLGSRNDWENLQKQEKAEILSFQIDDNKFLKLLYFIFDIYNNENCYRGKIYKIPRAGNFFQYFKPRKKIKSGIYLKMDIASSTALVRKYSSEFSNLVDDIFDEIQSLSADFKTGLVADEGDALYFIFNNESITPAENCNNLVLFSVKTLHWLKHFNLFINPLADDVKLKILGMSIPVLDTGNNIQKAVRRLTWLEKEHSEPDYILIDETIAQHINNNIISRFSIGIIPVDGLSTRFYSYTINFEPATSCPDRSL